MLCYIEGFFKNLFNMFISFLAFVDNKSILERSAKINRFAKIVNSSIGNYTYIGVRSWVINAKVGRFCSIANDVNIGLAKHSLDYLSTSPIFTEEKNATGHTWTNQTFYNPTSLTNIGNDVWIGYRAIIRSGVSIGDGAVIGTGAVVTKDIPPYAIVGGVPAKVLRYRYSQEIIDQLRSLKWWNMEEKILKKNISLFQHPLSALDIDKLKRIK